MRGDFPREVTFARRLDPASSTLPPTSDFGEVLGATAYHWERNGRMVNAGEMHVRLNQRGVCLSACPVS